MMKSIIIVLCTAVVFSMCSCGKTEEMDMDVTASQTGTENSKVNNEEMQESAANEEAQTASAEDEKSTQADVSQESVANEEEKGETVAMPKAPDISLINSIIPGRVSVSGTDFMVADETIYMNGVNTPWDKWNDFGGSFNESFWREHFKELSENGINAARVWISCNGDVGIKIDENGFVSGATDKHWQDLDTFFTIAEENGIYIMATLMSFDHFKDTNKNYMSWQKMVQSEDAIDSYVTNYVIPFCERYDDFHSLWSIDLCNEPDWIYENAECGKLAWKDICTLFAKEAAAIHRNSDILVTVGFAMIKYNCDSYSGNYGSDAYLQSCYDDKDAFLDFYSTHFYEWEAPWFGFPFDKPPAEFKLDGTKPCVIGEFPAVGMFGDTKGSQEMTPAECYVNCYNNGWNGIMAWTSNGVDSCGSLEDFKDGALEVFQLQNKRSEH